MREAATTGHFGVTAACGARCAKASAHAVVLLAACVLLTACPPDGGDLVPRTRGGGASLATRSFEGDTLTLTRDGVTLGARGVWSVADAATSVILEVGNTNAEPAAIDLGRAELSIDGGGGRMTLRSATREFGGAVAFLADKRVELGGGEAATFVLEFKIDSGDGRSGVPRDMTGQAVTLRLPVEVGRGAAHAAEFVFGFEYSRRLLRP